MVTTLTLTLTALQAFPTPLKRRRIPVPMLCHSLKPGDDFLGSGGMLTRKCPTLQNALDALGHVQPRTTQRGVQRHDPVTKQPQDKLRCFMTRQIVEDQQHP